MIKIFVKYFLSGLFVFSAIAKLLDYQNTVKFFDEIFLIESIYSKIILSTLIYIEIIIAYIILFDYFKSKVVFGLIISLMFLFLFMNVLFAISGKDNCGCFGTAIISTPIFSIIKNVVIIFATLYLRNSSLSYTGLKTQKVFKLW